MSMQFLEGEFRKGKLPGDLERADEIAAMLELRGKDIPLPFKRTVFNAPSHEGGLRKMVEVHRPDGNTVRVPEVLKPSETKALQYLSQECEQREEDPFVSMNSLAGLFSADNRGIKTGAVYKLVDRLAEWGYVQVRWDVLDPDSPGHVIRRKYIAITEHGKSRMMGRLE